MSGLNSLLASMMRFAAPLILIGYGGIFSFRLKIFPIILEALAISGCFFSIVGAYLSGGSAVIGFLAGAIGVMLISLLFGVFVFELNANAIVAGYAFFVIMNSLSRFLMPTLFDVEGRLVLDSDFALTKINLGFLKKIPIIGGILGEHTIFVYVSLLLSLLVFFILYRTTFGLSLRTTGENEETAVFANIHTKKIKYIGMALCGIFCGLGGAQLALGSGLYKAGMTDGRGYIALAAIVLSNGEPFLCMLICVICGLANALVIVLSSSGMNAQLLATIPYVITILVAVVPPIVQFLKNKAKVASASHRIAAGNMKK